ncbi:RlpA-like double-psi beta-barrel-protein domain-containing protein-containing protein, partial [Mycena vulgaris]
MFSKAFSAFLVTALAVSASPLAPLEARQGCAQTYTVASGDTWAAIESRTGVSDARLHALNPSIDGGCTSGGGSGGVCEQTYTVVSGDSCAAIESRIGVSDAQLHALNSSINGGCTNLQIGQVLCLGGGGGTPPGVGESFNGLATFYDPDGGLGACGSPLQNGDFIVALGTGHWDGGSHCGQTLNVQYHGRTIQVSVQDFCPGCQGANGLDLSEGAMAALDSNYINDGVI